MTDTEKPKVKKKKTNRLTKLQLRFIEFFKQLPIQKAAAEFVGIHEDTVTDWKTKNKVFSDQLGKAKSEWALSKSTQVKSVEWLLERVLKEYFAERKEFDFGTDQKLEETLDRIAKLFPASK